MFNTARIDHLYQDPHAKEIRLKLHYGDMTDSMNLTRIIQEIYNAAAKFTVDVLNKDRVKIHFANPMDRIYFPNMKEGTKVMVCEKESRDSLDARYVYKILSTYRDCKMVEITERKTSKK